MSNLLKRTVSCIVILSVICWCFIGCSQGTESDKTVIKLNEVVRSSFYAPMYVAVNQGYFEEEGIEIDLSTGQGAESTTSKTQEGAKRHKCLIIDL